MIERERIVPVFGGEVVVRAAGRGPGGLDAPAALVLAEATLREIHDRLTLFDPDSELSRLNADPREEVPVSPLLARFASAVRPAGLMSGGLVDATVTPGGPAGAWRDVTVSADRRTVRRPAGVRLDSGGLAKGMAADIVAERLAGHDSFVVECLGDLRTGGRTDRTRPVFVRGPHEGDDPLDILDLHQGAVATSGVTRRAGHLLDPRTAAPAETGVIQATAIAATGLEAEIRAKTALLAGPGRALEHLPLGGAVVLADGTVISVPARQSAVPEAVAA